MSMVGSEILSDSVSKSSNPSEILSLLNKGIKSSLRQTESNESTRDGMDIALCILDQQNQTIHFSGANRPLWIIRNGQTQIEEIKSTKKAIGGFTEDKQIFEPHEIRMNKGDSFYCFTDGYIDQFNGKSGKKLMAKKFKEVLLNIQKLSMPEQEIHLNNFIENWKGDTEQIDDILVIGVRV